MPLTALQPVPSLAAGARVALVAPAGGLRGEEDVARAVENARSFGWEPVVGRYALEHAGYFAGTDAQRLSDLNSAVRDPSVDGIWCIRGGYGMARLLPDIDFDALKRNPKAIIGFSDATALHCALQRESGIVSFHGPVARANLSDFSRTSLTRAVVAHTDSAGEAPAARTVRPQSADGILAGGNLAVLTSLAGTRYAPELDGAILVLEDIGERIYRIDRMLRQLYLADLLGGCSAIVFGECTNCGEATESGQRTLDEVLGEMADLLGVPCLAGVPVGHLDDQWTLPFGVAAHLDADARTLNVNWQ